MLSPFHAAIVASASGEEGAVREWLRSGGDVARVLERADCDAVADIVDLRAGQTLVDIALKRDHAHLVMLLLGGGDEEVEEDAAPAASSPTVVDACAGQPAWGPSPDAAKPELTLAPPRSLVRRHISHVNPSGARMVRRAVIEHLNPRSVCDVVDARPRRDGLVAIHGDVGDELSHATYFLPADVAKMPSRERRAALGLLLEASDAAERL